MSAPAESTEQERERALSEVELLSEEYQELGELRLFRLSRPHYKKRQDLKQEESI